MPLEYTETKCRQNIVQTEEKILTVSISRANYEDGVLCYMLVYLDNPWMAMSLIDSTVRTEKVEILVSLYIPYKYTWNSRSTLYVFTK